MKGLAQDVKCYVHGCTAYYHTKLPNEKPYSLLRQLEIPCHLWQNININFIIKLPPTTPDELPTHGGNAIIITFINALTKHARWVAANEKGLTAECFAAIFLEVYFRLYSLSDIVLYFWG